jgi:hypothetical protein
VNDEPEAMMVLPPMSDSAHDSLADKIILLSAQKAEMPLPTVENEEWQMFWRTLSAELPAFVDFLVNWKIPDEFRHPRFGVKAWQHPRLLAALDALAPETRLLVLIDEVIFTETEDPPGTKNGIRREEKWEGTAEQLERRLCVYFSDCSNEARRLLSWPSATGTHLGRLAHNTQTGSSPREPMTPETGLFSASLSPPARDAVTDSLALIRKRIGL